MPQRAVSALRRAVHALHVRSAMRRGLPSLDFGAGLMAVRHRHIRRLMAHGLMHGILRLLMLCGTCRWLHCGRLAHHQLMRRFLRSKGNTAPSDDKCHQKSKACMPLQKFQQISSAFSKFIGAGWAKLPSIPQPFKNGQCTFIIKNCALMHNFLNLL